VDSVSQKHFDAETRKIEKIEIDTSEKDEGLKMI
jgi:hypothetical protein